MSRKTVRKRRVPPRHRVPREGRPIAKDNSVIGVLSFVGVFLFLVLIGIIFIDSGNERTDNYQEEFAYNDNNGNKKNSYQPNKTKQNDKDNPKNKETKKKQPTNQDKIDNTEQDKNQEVANNKVEKENPQQEGIRGLPAQQLAQKNPKNKSDDDLNLSEDEKYRIGFERAKRSGNVTQLMSLAKWCEEKEMPGRAEDVYRQVISIEPNNTVARKSLGYIRLGSTWAKEENAEQLGYYKFKGKFVNAKSLRDRGLYLYQGDWLTKKDLKTKGLVLHKDNVVTKEELKALKRQEKEEKKNRQTAQEKQEKRDKPVYSEQIALSFREIRIYTPPSGKWSLSGSGRGAQVVSNENNPTVNTRQNGLRDTLADAESNIVLRIQGFSPEILYTFSDGSAAQGSEIKNLLTAFRGESFNLYQGLRFERIRRTRYGSEVFTQQFGVGTNNRKKYAVLLSFFRYGTLTYAIRITYPVPDNKSDNKLVQQKINYLFSNMKKVRDNY
ncbi:hypothetical protein [Candidatus Uabimicrobium sp. HlEnr_7]|uniref:hypothetical protein n=1 Tax=Candidatus Uabimicrobium helgolandensis TaxID=3095367 RepID=UPI00355736FD